MNIAGLVVSFGLLIIAMTVHEFSHALTAYKLGDPTAKYSGRLTLNPFKHIDPIGTIILPIFLFITTKGQFVFGAAKPVPINYQALRNPKRDIIWVGISGPLANFFLAAILSLISGFLEPDLAINFIIRHLIFINVVLGTFNLVPVPPLDGSRILMGLLPQPLAAKYAMIEPFGFIIIILLISLGIIDFIIMPIIRLILILLAVPI